MKYNQRSAIRWERRTAWQDLRTTCAEVRPTALAVWWVLGATESRIAPDKLARRLDAYVKRGADRSRVWAIVAWKLRWYRTWRLAYLDLSLG